MKSAFTLVEMIVVIMIMMMVMATLLPTIALIQKKADLYNTANVIRTVHNVQRSYAMQFGYGGAIYGYTIHSNRTGIQPWVGTPATSMSAVDIGKQMFWAGITPDYISFTDNIQPVEDTQSAGTAPANLTNSYHVAFVPRAGFAVATTDGSTPVATLGSSTPAGLVFRLRSTRSGYRDANRIEIARTGVINIYAP